MESLRVAIKRMRMQCDEIEKLTINKHIINQVKLIDQDLSYIMPAEDYQGWKNRATWACALHLQNDFDMTDYKDQYNLTSFGAEGAEMFVKDMYPKGIPDISGSTYDVDWEETTHHNPVLANKHGDIDWCEIAAMIREYVGEE